jgi:hypothetical protein
MKGDEEELSSFRDGHWRVQPTWVKALTFIVALPAWVVWMWGVFTGELKGTLETAVFVAFGLVVLLQMAFAFRAYWRMDL